MKAGWKAECWLSSYYNIARLVMSVSVVLFLFKQTSVIYVTANAINVFIGLNFTKLDMYSGPKVNELWTNNC